MVSFTGHVLPVLATIAVWFFATGLIAWAANAPRESYGRSLIWAGVVGAGGMLCVIASARIAGVGGAYLGFAGAMAVWGWHEFAFLTGGVTGPRREPCPEGAQGIVRFAKASAAVLHHEIALAATAAILIALCWGQPNPIGAQVFVLLFALRLVGKGMTDAFGVRLKMVLGLGTRTGPRAFFSGLVATLALQSSTATALMTASL